MPRPKTKIGPQKKISFEIPEADYANGMFYASSLNPPSQPGPHARTIFLESCEKGRALKARLAAKKR